MAIPSKIKQLANDIRTKIYGKDVRESLAKGIEESGSIADEADKRSDQTEQRQTALEQQFTDVVQNATDVDPSSVELVAGRTNTETQESFATIGQRLDAEHQSVTAQLAEKVKKGEVSVLDIDKNKGKFDQTYMTDEFLQQMAGNAPINATPAKRSLTSDRYALRSVNHDVVDFMVTGKNLFDKEKVLQGYYINQNTGGLIALSGYETSYLIPMKVGNTYNISALRKFAMFDLEENFVSGIDQSQGKYTFTAQLDGFFRFSYQPAGTNGTNIQVELGNASTTYHPFGYKIPKLIAEEDRHLSIFKQRYEVTIESEFGNGDIISIQTTKDSSRSGVFNFVKTAIGKDVIHSNFDDIAPVRTFYTVGANHGYFCVDITFAGKTTSDIGSVWTDGTNQWILVNVVGSTLTFIPDYVVEDGVPRAVTAAFPTANLTHVNGATNTSLVSITTRTIGQLRPSINKHKLIYELDGKELKNDGAFNGDVLKVIERYNVIDYKSLVDYIKANIGQYFANNVDAIDGVLAFNIIYEFSKGANCTVHHSIMALKKVAMQDNQLLQSQALSLSGYTPYQYIPNVKPKGSWDFKNLVNMDTISTSLNFRQADRIDLSIPVNRYVQWLMSGSDKKIGFAMGYIGDKGDGAHDKRIANAPTLEWELRNTKKNYALMLNSKILEPGDRFNIIGYRNYISPTVGATNVSTVDVGSQTYVYLDFHETKTFESIKMPDHAGKNITIVEKSSSFNLHDNNVGADGILFSVTGGYGYAVLKLL